MAKLLNTFLENPSRQNAQAVASYYAKSGDRGVEGFQLGVLAVALKLARGEA